MSGKATYEELEHKIQALELSHQRRLRFERLLTELLVTFVNIPANEVDQKVETVLRRIGEIIRVDRTDIIQVDEASGLLKSTHSWTTEGIPRITSLLAADHWPWLDGQLRNSDNPVVFSKPEDFPAEAVKDIESMKKFGIKSGLIIPFRVKERFVSAVAFGSHTHHIRVWPEDYIQRLRLLGETLMNAIFRKQADMGLRKAFEQIHTLKDQLQKENIYLRDELHAVQKHHDILGQSDAIKEVIRNIKLVAKTNSTVLISGETGTGKELVARAIHKEGTRYKRSMVTVNCGALPETLVESELFGREKGAYTGAVSKQIGRFELAEGSTIFLDEIGEIPKDLQVKLLRVLQYGKFERLGGNKTISVDVRVIAATNRDLLKAIGERRFREDLYYRLNVFPIHVPPLRERTGDILALTWAFIDEFNETMGRRVETISRSSLEDLQCYSWPGNVRELKNVVERAVITSKGKALAVDVPEITNTCMPADLPIAEYERRYILQILDKTGWRIRGKMGAAEILGLKPTTLYSRMKKFNIKRPVAR